MNDAIVITYIYQEFWGTKRFRKSVKNLGLPLHNAFSGSRFGGDGQALRSIYEGYLELKDKYKNAVYSDGADTYLVKTFEIPEDKIIYSTEKAVWPPTEEMKKKWNDYYKDKEVSLWKYLNGGNCCGPIELIIEFFEKYGIQNHAGKEVNGQGIVADAFLQAQIDGFPIELDTECRLFQTTGFSEPGELVSESGIIRNTITCTTPSIFHGNGRTDLSWLYNLDK